MSGDILRKPVIGLFICAMLLAHFPLTTALPAEDQNFQPKHTAIDFPVGFTDANLDSGKEVRVVYPAMQDGENSDMAGNGPFPWLVFFGDEGEVQDDYMILVSKIVERGFIMVITMGVEVENSQNVESNMEILVSITELMNNSNNSNSIIIGSFANIDMNHWAISGHGTGAAQALSLYPFWNNTNVSDTYQPPRGIFGLGADFSGWASGDVWENLAPNGWTIEPATPATGLFLTGTVDEIARGQDNLPYVQSVSDFAWQWMHVLGANHYQFQDEIDDGFFFGDDRGDGDATMTQQEQIDYAAAHITAYLDLINKGEHNDFKSAFNRESDLASPSDTQSYIVEDLYHSEMLLTFDSIFPSQDENQFGRYDSFSLMTNFSLRDSTPYSQIDTNWQIDIICGVNKIEQSVGILHNNGTAQCDYQVENLEPGIHLAYLTISVEGAPSTIEHEFVREDLPLAVVVPKPDLLVPERGTGSLLASEIAVDPDGQEVYIVDAELVGGQIDNFSIEVSPDSRTLFATHTVDGEFLMGAEVGVTLRAEGGQIIDELYTILEILVVPFNDQIVQNGSVAVQTLIEDGISISVNITDYVYDPEGEPLLASINGQSSGNAGPVAFSYVQGVMTITPLPDANGATILHVWVTDGANDPVEVDIPVQVTAVDDEPIVNESAWQRIGLEDETQSFNLSEFGYDLDGDDLVWTTWNSGQSADFVNIFGNQLVLNPPTDFHGTHTDEWLNVTDGVTTFSKQLTFIIQPVDDLPSLLILDTNIVGNNTITLTWSISDPDGFLQHEISIQVENITVDNFNPSCLIATDNISQECVAMLQIPSQLNGTIQIRLSAQDSAFTSKVVAYTAINFNASAPVQDGEQEVQDSTSDSNMTLILSASLGLIILILVLLIILRSVNNTGEVIVPQQEIEQTSIAEQELGVDLSSSGLLARIGNNK